MLHVTNGDSAEIQLRSAGFTERVLPWRDVLHEGPVPADLPLDDLSRLRATFLSGCGWGAPEPEMFAARDRSLRVAPFVTLWFEHDLYDQLQLLQVIDIVVEHRIPAELVPVHDFIGSAGPEQLLKWWEKRRRLGLEQRSIAQLSWQAFRSADLNALPTLLDEEYLEALPHLRSALVRLLEDRPSARDGLSRTERQILRAVDEGAATFEDLFEQASRMEEARFLGDSVMQLWIDRLLEVRVPLLSRPPYRLTEAGRKVLAGQLNHQAINRIDRWMGGVHFISG